MLTPEDEDFVVNFLGDYLAPLQDFRTAAVASLPAALSKGIAASQTPQSCARLVVTACMVSSFDYQPTALSRLLTPYASNAKICEIMGKLANLLPPPAGKDPFDAYVLASGLPFVNRTKLRRIVRTFLQPTLKPVLLVSGTSRTGKSYTTTYIRHLGVSSQQLRVCDIEYPEDHLASTTPLDVAKDMVALMGRPSTGLATPDTNNARWLRNLARSVLEEASATAQRWWFVLDGFYGPKLRSDTSEFVNAFLDIASRGAGLWNFRVILLGFDRSSLKSSAGTPEVESLAHVRDEEVVTCVIKVLAASGNGAVDPQPFADAILGGLPAGDARLEEINRRLSKLIEAMAGDVNI